MSEDTKGRVRKITKKSGSVCISLPPEIFESLVGTKYYQTITIEPDGTIAIVLKPFKE